jgi:hypothetical protein
MLPEDIFLKNSRSHRVHRCKDVNRIPFFVSVSKKIQFGTIQDMSSRMKANVLKAMDRMLAIYQARGFKVRYMLMEKLEPYSADLAGGVRRVMLNTTSNDECHGNEANVFITSSYQATSLVSLARVIEPVLKTSPLLFNCT